MVYIFSPCRGKSSGTERFFCNDRFYMSVKDESSCKKGILERFLCGLLNETADFNKNNCKLHAKKFNLIEILILIDEMKGF